MTDLLQEILFFLNQEITYLLALCTQLQISSREADEGLGSKFTRHKLEYQLHHVAVSSWASNLTLTTFCFCKTDVVIMAYNLLTKTQDQL